MNSQNLKTAEQTAHTPTPWSYKPVPQGGNTRAFDTFDIFHITPDNYESNSYGVNTGRKFKFIGTLRHTGSKTISEGNAKFIVKAVNNHDRLIKALKIIRQDCEMALSGAWDKSDEGFQDTLEFINETLEKAEE